MSDNEQAQSSDKDVTIIVNGTEKTVDKNSELTYEQVIALAFANPPTGENILITVTYRRGHGNKPEGSLEAGDPAVKVKEGMIFDVTPTDKS